MKKKILFFHFDLQGGGAERVLVTLLNHLDYSKYDVTLQVIFGVGHNLKSLPEQVHFKSVFNHQFRGFAAFMKLFSGRLWYRLFVRDKYDIEIAYLETSPTRIIGGSTNNQSKKIAWVHTTLSDQYQYSRSFRSREESVRCYNCFDKVIFVSQGALSAFNNYLPEVVAPKEVIHNVNDYDSIVRIGKDAIEDNVLLPGAINICSVGRLIPLKGYDRLIKIIGRIKKEEPQLNIKLTIIGDGSSRESLNQLIKGENLERVVSLIGYRDNPYKYMSKMDLFVSSSYIEGYSTVVSESIALGVPVLTTKCSGMSEILNDGKYGLIVDNNDVALYQGLKSLIQNPDIIQDYKRAIKNECSFSTQESVSKYEELFDDL